MQENWLLRLYQDTGMSGLCGKATYGNDARDVHMYAISLYIR